MLRTLVTPICSERVVGRRGLIYLTAQAAERPRQRWRRPKERRAFLCFYGFSPTRSASFNHGNIAIHCLDVRVRSVRAPREKPVNSLKLHF
jgi:hypothetical protein